MSAFLAADWPGFYAAFGFLACVALVVLARILGWWLKRPDDYYGKQDD